MMNVARMTCLWPGLPRLWFRGDWGALLVAAGFAGLVNFLLVTSFLWPEVAPAPLRAVGLVLAAVWWGGSLIVSLRQGPLTVSAPPGDSHQGLFVSAQSEYLKGNWPAAEAHLRKLLRRAPRDVEALLLMAAIARRTDRFDQARAHLQALARLEAAGRWELEIRCERELLRRLAQRQKLEEIEHGQIEHGQMEAEPDEPPATTAPPGGWQQAGGGDDSGDGFSRDGTESDLPAGEATTDNFDGPWRQRRAA